MRGHDGETPATMMPADLRFALGLRGRHLLALDLLGVSASAGLAVAVIYERVTALAEIRSFPLVLVLLLAVRTICNIRLGLYSQRWRYASVPELVRIVGAVGIGSLASMAVFYGATAVSGTAWAVGFPRSFWLIELLLSVSILGGVRFGIRAAFDQRATRRVAANGMRPALLYGAGSAGATTARAIRHDPGAGLRPVGFLDDDPGLAGQVVAGVRVFGGLGAMERAVAETGATVLIVTMPTAPGIAVRRALEAALALRLEVQTVPSLHELLDGRLDVYRIRRVKVEDLLRRPLVNEHAEGVERIIRDQTVLITGGAGSIGSELARQVFAIGPRRLVLVDRAESPLYLIQRELEARRDRRRGSGELRFHLANVASRGTMRQLMAAERPSVIFHAAAYKHVPLMESHPCEAAYVNIVGTREVLDAAEEAGVERFVFVSTDKAVHPASVMGASKRIAEMLVADAARRTGRPYVSVRFGNVLGSTGSVVPIFQAQLESGEPLTITDPEMTRYFMTIPEAAWLILDAGALGCDGDLFVLDMGDPVRVIDLARDLVRLAGRDPDSQPIATIGLRPGEKLHEELFYDAEAIEPTTSAKVLRAIAPEPPVDVRDRVEQILRLAAGDREPELRAAILEYARACEASIPARMPRTRGRRAPTSPEAASVSILQRRGRREVALRR